MELSFFLRFLLAIGLVLLLVRCTRKPRSSPNDLAGWLESRFPGRFTVLSSTVSDPIRNLSFKVKFSIVAEKSDTSIQADITWDKREAGFGLDSARIVERFDAASRQVKMMRTLLQHTQKQLGFPHGIAYYRGELSMLVFAETAPEQRESVVNGLLQALKSNGAFDENRLGLYLMDPQQRDSLKIEPLITLDDWIPGRYTWLKHAGLYQSVNLSELPSRKQLNESWVLYQDGDMTFECIEAQQAQAEAWGKKHLPKPFTIIDGTRYDALKGRLGLSIDYPFTYDQPSGENATIHGYISGEYALDNNDFSKLRLLKEE